MSREQLTNYAAVFTGGCFGGLARYGVGVWLAPHSLIATLIINLLGSFLLAFLTYAIDGLLDLPNWLILMLGTGFVGAFTTFSTLIGATEPQLLTHPLLAGGYVIGTMVGGLILALAGMLLARRLGRGRWEW